MISLPLIFKIPYQDWSDFSDSFFLIIGEFITIVIFLLKYGMMRSLVSSKSIWDRLREYPKPWLLRSCCDAYENHRWRRMPSKEDGVSWSSILLCYCCADTIWLSSSYYLQFYVWIFRWFIFFAKVHTLTEEAYSQQLLSDS